LLIKYNCLFYQIKWKICFIDVSLAKTIANIVKYNLLEYKSENKFFAAKFSVFIFSADFTSKKLKLSFCKKVSLRKERTLKDFGIRNMENYILVW
jgi:hypothetical protein